MSSFELGAFLAALLLAHAGPSLWQRPRATAGEEVPRERKRSPLGYLAQLVSIGSLLLLFQLRTLGRALVDRGHPHTQSLDGWITLAVDFALRPMVFPLWLVPLALGVHQCAHAPGRAAGILGVWMWFVIALALNGLRVT